MQVGKVSRYKKRGQCLPDRQRINRYAHTINSNFFDVSEFRPVMDHIFDNYLKIARITTYLGKLRHVVFAQRIANGALWYQ